MSLQHAAQHLAAHGRGPDTTLMHVTPGEIKSLNDLAMAHGGHLTINPHTGLPEAGFLSAILPMLAGVALGPAGMGLMSAGAAGLTVGGLTGLATGSLSKGLMAGMGAYGGAGLGDALAQSGMQAAAAPEISAAQSQLSSLTPAQIAEFQGATGPVTSGPVFEAQQAAQQAAQKMAAQQTAYGSAGFGDKLSTLGQGVSSLGSKEGLTNFMNNAGGGMGLAKYGLAAASPLISELNNKEQPKPVEDKDMGQRYTYSPNKVQGPYTASPTGVEQRYFNPVYTPVSADKAKSIYGFADGGIATATPMPGEQQSYEYDPMTQLFAKIESMPSDDQKKQMGEAQSTRQGGFGFKGQETASPSTQSKTDALASGLIGYGDVGFLPGGLIASLVGNAMVNSALSNAAINGGYTGTFTGPAAFGNRPNNIATEGGTGPISGEAFNNSGHGGGGNPGGIGIGLSGVNGSAGTATSTSSGNAAAANGGLMAAGGLSDAHYNLGGYSDGGRLLRGPGDGVSDSIPATIGHKQPARLADGEFVVPARIVSELGNGSTEAGARKLYAMMDRVQSARSKTVGKGKIAKNSKAEKYLPA